MKNIFLNEQKVEMLVQKNRYKWSRDKLYGEITIPPYRGRYRILQREGAKCARNTGLYVEYIVQL